MYCILCSCIVLLNVTCLHKDKIYCIINSIHDFKNGVLSSDVWNKNVRSKFMFLMYSV